MAEAIPTADPGLLAAQAKAGQAGVDAYNSAISTLQSQKQGAVQIAMQEAAMRGSPAGAAQSQQGIITQPYDTRIASLTQNLAGYQAGQEARTGRMNDYNQAVMAARSYIPEVTEQAVAPIRANADFQVRNTEMRGQQEVAGIDADTRLTMARMAAAFQAAQIAAAKKAADDAAKAEKAVKLNQGELGGLMSDRAASLLSASGSEIRDMIAANQKTITQNAVGALSTSTKKNQPAYDAARHSTGVANLAAILLDASRLHLDKKRQEEEASKPGSFMGNLTSRWGTSNPGGFMGNLTRSMTDQWGWASQGRKTQANISALQRAAERAKGAQNQAGGNVLRDLFGTLATSTRDLTTKDPLTGRGALVSRSQAEAMDPFTREMLFGATQQRGITGVKAFDDVIWGSPNEQNQGIGNPYSSDVVRNAMVQVAQKLQDEGYDVRPEDVAASLPDKMPSIYNLLAGRSDQPSSQDEYKAAQAARADEDKRREELADDEAAAAKEERDAAEEEAAAAEEEEAAYQADIEAQLIDEFGVKPPANLGTPVQVLNRMATNAAVLGEADTRLKEILDKQDQGHLLTRAQIAEKLRREVGLSPNLIETLLYMNGI